MKKALYVFLFSLVGGLQFVNAQTITNGGSTSGGATSTATNQITQISRETAIQDSTSASNLVLRIIQGYQKTLRDNQVTGNANLVSIDGKLTSVSTSTLQSAGNTSLSTIATNSAGQSTASLQSTGNTSLGTIATNSGLQATASNQSTGNASLATIATNSATFASQSNQTTGNASLATIATNTGAKTASFGANAPSGQNIIASNTTITTTNCIKVTITNAGLVATTFTYLGQVYALGIGGQVIIPADWDYAKQVYAPFGAMVVDGATASTGGVNVAKVFAQ
jgi:hypothetical protein